MAVYQPKKVTAMPGSPTANTVYFVKNVGDSRIQMYVTDTSGTAFPVGILTENDVLGTSLAGFSTGSDIALSSSDTIIQAFQKVQGQINALSTSVSQGMKVPLPLDCSIEPNYPTAEAGDSYKVTVAGKIGGASGPIVQVGDVITALTDNGGGIEAAVGTQWFILQANTDNATESVTGLTRIATQAEVNTGSEAFAYVTPLTLDGKLGDYVPEARTLTINGVTQDLSESRSFNRLVSSDPNSGQTSAAVFGGDLNSIKINTIYTAAASATNVPAPSTGIVFKGVSADTNNGFEFYGARGGNLYTRGLDSGIYSSWEQVAYRSWVTDQNYQPAGNYVEATSAATNKTAISGGDFNLLDSTSFGAFSSGSNMPNGRTTGFFINNFTSTGGGMQLFMNQQNEDEFSFRKSNAGAFGSWFRVASREWVTSQNYQVSGNYVVTDPNSLPNVISSFGGDLDTVLNNSIYFANTGATNSPDDGTPYVVFQGSNTTGASGFRLFGGVGSEEEFYFQRRSSTSWNNIYQVASREWANSTFQAAGNYQTAGKYKTLDSLTAVISAQTSGVDANAVFSYSNLFVVSSTGLPTGYNAGFLDTTPSYGEGFAQQFTAFGGSTDAWYYRKKLHGSSPTPWFQVASREWANTTFQTALANPVTGTGSSGRVAIWNGTNSVYSSANFTYSGGVLYAAGKLRLGDVPSGLGNIVSIDAGGNFYQMTPSETLSQINGQASRSITSSSSNIEISGGAAGSTSTDINVVWGAAEW